MVYVDLVTGFLGAGKTTFIRQYTKYLVGRNERVGIVENDYGSINVDALLLQDLVSDDVRLEMVAGGCDNDCYRRRLKTKLLTLALQGYSRILVEPSGIFDVEEFFDILQEEPLYERVQIHNVITVVNANLGRLSEQSGYLLVSQIANAGKVVFSFWDNQNPRELMDIINGYLKQQRCGRQLTQEDIVCLPFENYTSLIFDSLNHAGYHTYSYERQYDDSVYTSLFFMNHNVQDIRKTVGNLFSDEFCGRVIRIKGCYCSDEVWYAVNATKDMLRIHPMKNGQSVLIVIGEQLDESVISQYIPAEYSTLQVNQNSNTGSE
ncbi:MAG: GTPase (G3E family) [Erysipelotrichaceae bacterium]|nr:GTPase (G3E family) [Erysipelotrichaceae bacterium]